MNAADRLAAMTAELPQPIAVGDLIRYAPDAANRRRLSFEVAAGDRHLAQVAVIPGHSGAPQEHVDAFALALQSLLRGSEDRVADAEARVARQRGTITAQDTEIQRLRKSLADFEQGRDVRGPFYACEDLTGGVWLVGRPSTSAWGFHFGSWAELARDRPGLRPCGTCKSDDCDSSDTYVVMRPIGDLGGAR